MCMKKRVATAIAVALFAGPFVAVAESAVQNNSQITTLYAQLIVLLQKIASLQKQSVISVSPDHGAAPLTVQFAINNPTGTESIIFGDGGYSGQTCIKKANGWCDFSKPLAHTYALPGTYTVNVYTHNGEAKIVSTSTVVVTK